MKVELLHIYTGHADAIYALCKGHAEGIFYSGSADQFVGSWNAALGTFDKPLVKATGSIYALCHDIPQQTLYVGQRKGIIIQVDLTKEQIPRSYQAHESDVFCIEQVDENRIATGSADGHLKIWSKNPFKLLHDFKLSDTSIRSIHIYQKEIFVGLSDHTIRVFDTDTWTQKQLLQGHQNSVFTITTIDENTLVSAGRDATFIIWKKTDHQWISAQSIPAHMYTVNHLSLSPNGQLLASASRDKTFKIWDAQTMKLLKVINRQKVEAAHTHSINRVLWLDDQTLLTTGDDKKIIAWQVK